MLNFTVVFLVAIPLGTCENKNRDLIPLAPITKPGQLLSLLPNSSRLRIFDIKLVLKLQQLLDITVKKKISEYAFFISTEVCTEIIYISLGGEKFYGQQIEPSFTTLYTLVLLSYDRDHSSKK